MKKILLSIATCMLGVTMLHAQAKPVLTQKWINSVSAGNYVAPGGDVRGMAFANGKLYFSDKSDLSLNVHNPETGAFIKKVMLPDAMKDGIAFPNNCLRTDAVGNLLISNIATNLKTVRLQVWMLTNEDATPVLLLDQAPLPDHPLFNYIASPRIDYIGVYGDVTKNGYILAGLSSPENTAAYVLKWNIVNGIVIDSTPIDYEISEFSPSKSIAIGGTGTFVLPISDNLFYIDGSNIYPTLYSLDEANKTAVCERGFFTREASGITDLAEKPGAVTGNGIAQVELDNRTFIVVANNNHGTSDIKNSFKAYELGADMDFSTLSLVGLIPESGLGDNGNTGAVLLPLVEKVSETKANIYIYAWANGYAKYELVLGGTGINTENISAQEAMICKDGKIYLPEVAKTVEVYSITGQKIADKTNTEVVNAPAMKGLYIVKAVYQNGTTSAQKISVR